MGDNRQANIDAYRAKIGLPPVATERNAPADRGEQKKRGRPPRNGDDTELMRTAERLGVIRHGQTVTDVVDLARRCDAVAPGLITLSPYLPGEAAGPEKRRATKRDRQPGGDRTRTAAPDPDTPTVKGKRWVRVFNADADKIMNSQAPELFAIAFAVWYALVREASYRRSLTFDASDAYLSKRLPGMRSRMTIRKATELLQSLGMLESVSRTIPGTKNREPLLRTLHPAGDMSGADGAATAQACGAVQNEEPEPSFV